jgi:predicted transcriptional regulator YdeE
MNYELVQLDKRKVAGLKIRTCNSDPNMSSSIGATWQSFFYDGIYDSIPNKKNDKTMGLYMNYENDVNGFYDMMACCEVEDTAELPKNVELEHIPSGNYAKFIIQGDTKEAVNDFWMKLWSMDLDRRYCCDFEEYQGGSDLENANIHIYISVN